MKTYIFSLIASGLNLDAEDLDICVNQADREDALLSFQNGRMVVEFAREAESIVDAIASAVQGIQSFGATVHRIEPDPLVSLADIAARTGMSRAAITHYSKGQRGKDFPPPIAKVTSNSPLWDWAIVARWLSESGRLPRDFAVEAEAIKQANVAIQCSSGHMGHVLPARVCDDEHIPQISSPGNSATSKRRASTDPDSD